MKITFLLSILFLSINSFSQTLTIQEIETDLKNTCDKLSEYRDADTLFDLLEGENKKLRDKLVFYTSNYPATLKYDFKTLKERISIVNSEDSLFRIYSWNTKLGGTMIDYENVYQYKLNGIITSKASIDSLNNTHDEEYITWIDTIFTLRNGDDTFYLAMGSGCYSSRDLTESIKVFKIENNYLNTNIRLFKTKEGLFNSLDAYYNLSIDENGYAKSYVKYDNKKKKIYIPITDDHGEFINEYLVYKFNGKYFKKNIVKFKI